MTIRNWMTIIAVCMLAVTGATPVFAADEGSQETHREGTAAREEAAPGKEQKKVLSTSRKIAGFGVLGVLIVWIFTRDMMARKKAKKESPPDKEESDDGEEGN